MNITLRAAQARGQAPFSSQSAIVDSDGPNVFLALPRTEGVIDAASAVALGQAILGAAGFAPRSESPATFSVPAGWYIKENTDGMALCDHLGVVQAQFNYEPRFVAE